MIQKTANYFLGGLKTKYIFLVFVLSISFSSFSQTDFIFVTAKAKYAAVIVNQGSIQNAKICKTSTSGMERTYRPSEIFGYMFQNGIKYYSKSILISDSIHQVFLETLIEGTVNLYYFRDNNSKRFFIQSKGEELFEIYPKEKGKKLDFDESLNGLLTDCDQIIKQKDLVRFTRRGLKTFVSYYNNCSPESIFALRYGVSLGYGMIKQSPRTKNTEIKLLDFGYSEAANFGFFIEHPLYISNFHLHLDVFFLKQTYWENYSSSEKEIDFVANVYSLNAPLIIRYISPNKKVRPFYNVGISFTYNFKKEESFSWVRYSNENSVYINYPDNQFVSDFQAGITLGAGLEYRIKPSFSIFGELRYNLLYGNPKESFTTKYIHLNVGVKF